MATGTPYFQAGSFGTPISIRDDSGQTTPIEHSSAYHAYKTLGTFQAATKRQTILYQMLKKKATMSQRQLLVVDDVVVVGKRVTILLNTRLI
jgi:hypothetical protein